MEVTNLEKGNTVFEPTKLIMATQLSRFTQNSKKSHFEECFYFLKNLKDPFRNCNSALCEKRGNSHAWKYLGVPVFKILAFRQEMREMKPMKTPLKPLKSRRSFRGTKRNKVVPTYLQVGHEKYGL